MSLTYAIAGILVGYAGGSIQATFQKSWVLITFSTFFVLLALSFFGLYELQLPSRLQNSLNSMSNRQKSGSYIGVAIMGCIATLIVSPCVTPALVGALAYIGQTGNAALGGTALFALGFGMGLPLLIIGTLGGKFLPKAGEWMESIKTIFGILLLGMAIWIIDRIIPGPLELLLWGALLILTAIFMGIFSKKATTNWLRLNHGISIVFFVYGVLLTIGAAMGNHDPLLPLHVNQFNSLGVPVETAFHPVGDNQQLNQALGKAKSENKLVLLDFYAKWCTSCKIMENRTFNHPDVIKALNNFVTLKADVTNNDQTAKLLEQQYKVVAPPTFLFFDQTGKELTQFRIVGEMGPEKFLEHLKTVQESVNK
jgi:thiol:disulfide interchange protein DsbD